MGAMQWDAAQAALAEQQLPCAVVDLDVLAHNIDLLMGPIAALNVTLRPASKSIRVPKILRYIAARHPSRVQGIMTFSPHEAVLLDDGGFGDFLRAYRPARRWVITL